MLRAQSHRGPDGTGRLVEMVGDHEVALGHGRLAILDLSPAGAQPMLSHSRGHAIIFNGEIYNYREVGKELEDAGVVFHTRSDTEVLLEALAFWGEDALPRLNGMWAFAWLQRDRRRITLARDRFGVKPLYHHTAGERFFFASEIKSILAGTSSRFNVNPHAVGLFLRQSLLDTRETTFFEGISAVPAGEVMHIDLAADRLAHASRRYWSLSGQKPFDGSIEEIVAKTRETFVDAVRLRLRSDVPVGVLLSGGVDSSAIAACMKGLLAGEQLHLISAVSDDAKFDETPFIERVTQHLGCNAHQVRLALTPDESFRLLSEVTRANDEPIGSFSYVAHYLLMQRAREIGVTVLLSGQGADEVLCGYRKYLGFYLEWLVLQGRAVEAARVLANFSVRGTVLSQFRFNDAKRYLPALLRIGEANILGPRLRDRDVALPLGLGHGDVVDRQIADVYQFSVPALVHYEDRMSMAFGREIRLPFLDYRFVSGALPLAPEYKLRDGWTKWILRKAIANDLPAEVCWRKDKQGFVNPQSVWLATSLRPRIESLFSGPMLTAQLGLIDQLGLLRRYRAYCEQPASGGMIGYKDVFNALALEIWAREFSMSLSDG